MTSLVSFFGLYEALKQSRRNRAKKPLDTILCYVSTSVENAMQQPFQGKAESDEDA